MALRSNGYVSGPVSDRLFQNIQLSRNGHENLNLTTLLRSQYFLLLGKGIQRDNFMSLNTCMKNAVLWNVTPRDSCKNRLFGGIHRLHLQGGK
jgi:hypothetical protein